MGVLALFLSGGLDIPEYGINSKQAWNAAFKHTELWWTTTKVEKNQEENVIDTNLDGYGFFSFFRIFLLGVFWKHMAKIVVDVVVPLPNAFIANTIF